MTKNFELSQFGSQLTVNDNTKEISIIPSVSIGGTLTYEDVTNIDSIGIVTARSGVHVPNGEILVGTAFSVGHSGIITSTRLHLFTDTGIDSGIRLQNGSEVRGNIYYDGDQSLIIHGSSGPGGGDTPTLEFATGTSPTTRLLITRDGNIGIGSISVPDSLVQIKSSGASANQARLTINEKYNSTDTSFGIDFKRTYDTGGDDQDAGYIHIDRSGGLNNTGLIFGIGNRGSVTEKLRIDPSGHARLTEGDLRVGDDTDSNAGTKTISVGSTSSGSSGGLQLWANPTNGNSFIQFGDGSASADQYRGWINYQHATDNLNFGTAGGEKLRITSGGNIGINSNDPTSYANSNATLVIEDSICPAICLSDTGQARDWFAIAQGAQLSINYADGGGSGSASNVTNAVTFLSGGATYYSRPVAFYDGFRFTADNNWQTIGTWYNGGNRGGAGNFLILLSQHSNVAQSKDGVYHCIVYYNGTLGPLTKISGHSQLSFDIRLSGSDLQVKAYDSGTGLSTACRISFLFNDGRVHLWQL